MLNGFYSAQRCRGNVPHAPPGRTAGVASWLTATGLVTGLSAVAATPTPVVSAVPYLADSGSMAVQCGRLIDGVAVNGSASLVGFAAGLLRKVQSGYLYHYAFAMILGLGALLALTLGLFATRGLTGGAAPLDAHGLTGVFSCPAPARPGARACERRALRVLRESDVIAAEDTRVTRKLLSHYDVHTHMVAYHQHSLAERAEELLGMLREGKNVALVSDAGTPGISDPGYLLIQAALAAGRILGQCPGHHQRGRIPQQRQRAGWPPHAHQRRDDLGGRERGADRLRGGFKGRAFIQDLRCLHR